ncbi:PREDICTED: uncharacterized protein LOC107191924 [Dufourea novaeangliae]|nr:PREDICTED: uncharacterized protein LOC107191924 [Dufourea novaeangliae]
MLFLSCIKEKKPAPARCNLSAPVGEHGSEREPDSAGTTAATVCQATLSIRGFIATRAYRRLIDMWWPPTPNRLTSIQRPQAFCILVLAISEPLLAHAGKVVVVMPQQIRRSPSSSWRPIAPRYRKSSQEPHYRRYHGTPGHYHSKKHLYSSPPYPHGGDDFDQGHESVNHVNIPYGKDISHAISYGKGYVPYDHIKGSFSFGREKYPGPQEHKQSEQVHAPTSYSTTGPEYPSSGHSQESPLPETFFADPESAMSYNERRNDRKKFYSSRSIEKELTANSPIDLSGVVDQGKEQLLFLQQKAAELYSNVSPQPQGNVLLPSGIPAATIGGSKEGIVIRDSVSLGEYQQKLQEMTKSWPQYLLNGASGLAGSYQGQQLAPSYSNLQPSSSFGGSFAWPLNIAQPKQGYAVKEDTMEPPHDFRSMPIQTNPFQGFNAPLNNALPSLAQTVNG